MLHQNIKPQFSCIITCYQESSIVAISIESILAQTFANYELIIVCDGSDVSTLDHVRSYRDPRIRIIEQSNDGLSSARNRALSLVNGEYVCFIDADDMRPAWALMEANNILIKTGADLLLCKGRLIESRNESLPFYDDLTFEKFNKNSFNDPISISEAMHLLLLTEPQTANKFIRADLIRKNHLVFPNGLFYEDFLFHMSALIAAKSIAVTKVPMFTYFRRYSPHQITSGSGDSRFDMIETTKLVLKIWFSSRYGKSSYSTSALILSLGKLLQWCNQSVSHYHKYQFLQLLFIELNPWKSEILKLINSEDYKKIEIQVHWGRSSTAYILEALQSRGR